MHVNLIPTTQFVVIEKLAREIWNAHYPGIISTQQIEYMLTHLYALDALQKQADNGQVFYLICNENREEKGFVSVTSKEDQSLFIHKFYINERGKGLGAAVFASLLNLYAPQKIQLTVNRYNIKAINFYFKLGFIIEKVADFPIGNDFVMEDFVMLWNKEMPGEKT
jgi:RimJ/RimL family protein N-acetyltransferase